MNVYRVEFFAACPNNGIRVHYKLVIESGRRLAVEHIVSRVESFGSGFHEDFADALHREFGGRQVLSAHHHGVDIETVRVAGGGSYLDQSLPGMAGTPGY